MCVQCGTVLEENSVVAEVTFAELADGSSALQGQFVSAERGKTAAPSIFGRRALSGSGGSSSKDGTSSGESREWTLWQAKRRLQSVALALGLGEHHIEQAHRWYSLALQHHFTRGRRATHIISACLYIVCRMEKTPHMLLDFADLLQTSVYVLGGCFLRLVQLLNLNMPIIDPSFYVARFASRLEFGDACQTVANTALRVVARMKRDWIQVGRRPAGVCAAGLLIAARMHGFRRSEREIVRVVHICEATLKKRLGEFEETPSGQLTPGQFEEIWLETEADPPAFRRSTSAAAGASSMLIEEEQDSWTREMVALHTPPATPSAAATAAPITEKEDPATLSDLDRDPELDNILLTPAETEAKTAWWTVLNADFLEREQAKLTAALNKTDETSGEQPPVKKARRGRKKASDQQQQQGEHPSAPAISAVVVRNPTYTATGPVAETAAEAAKKALSGKRFSRKINYEALEALFESTATAASASSTK